MKSKILTKFKYYTMALTVQPIVRLVVSFIPVDTNKFFFISMNGNNFGDNIKRLSDYIHRNQPGAKIVWGFTDSYYDKVDSGYHKVKICSLKYYYHILTSKYILSNFAMDFSFLAKKRKGQVYLQTWHGTPLKRIGYDMYKSEKPDILYRWFGVDRIKHTMDMTDILITGSTFMTDIFRNSFLYDRKIDEVGTPRNDIFFEDHPELLEKIKTQFGIGTNEHIVLYAPTFRQNRGMDYYNIDLSKLISCWEKKTGQKYRLLVRLHPVMLRKEQSFMNLFPDGTINVSLYPDMQELLYCADVLVTDYSSSMFDFMYLKRPIIMYVPDKETYSRGFYMDIDSLPFIVINNNKEIEDQLLRYEANGYQERVEVFFNKIGSKETGIATKNVYNLLMGS